MEFCPSCDGLMVPDKAGKKRLVCSKCNKGKVKASSMVIKEKSNTSEKKIEVVDKDIEVNPKVDAVCSKCDHRQAYFWTLQTRAADESETKFFKCAKCGHRWRDYT